MGESFSKPMRCQPDALRPVDATAADNLFPIVYEQLKEHARQLMTAESPDHTLQATALVHETYLRLLKAGKTRWSTRSQFFDAAARAMRRILVDHARTRAQVKRGGRLKRLPLEAVDLARDDPFTELVAIDDALSRLEAFSPEVAAVVRLRFFAGLTEKEAAESLGVSERTVRREWTYGRVWLRRELGEGRRSPGEG